MQPILKNLLARKKLAPHQLRHFLYLLEEGHLNDSQIAAILVAFQAKGLFVEEGYFLYTYFSSRYSPLKLSYPCIDISGTGGGAPRPFNVSMATAWMVAACGVKVAKSVRSFVSSSCGSKEILQALGIFPSQSITRHNQNLAKTNLTFCLPPLFKAFLSSMPVRKSLKIPTFFEEMAPLLSPIELSMQVIGVYSYSVMQVLGEIVQKLSLPKKIVFLYGEGGYDEVCPYTNTHVFVIEGGNLSKYLFTPQDFGIKLQKQKKPYFSCYHSVEAIFSLFHGRAAEEQELWAFVNVAFVLYMLGKCSSLLEGMEKAEAVIREKKVEMTFSSYVSLKEENSFKADGFVYPSP